MEGYDHTHFACAWFKRYDTTNPRAFDHNGIHPNIQWINNDEHAKRIWNYHRKDGVPTQSEKGPCEEESLFDKIKKAQSLADACRLIGIDPQSVGDVNLLRNDVERLPPYEHRFPNAKWILSPPDNWRTIFIYGPTGTGKTQWALHQFERPLLVRDFDDFRNFSPAYDGIVIDDVNFSEKDRTYGIMLAEWDERASLRCRYSNAIIPKETKKIFCSNLPFSQTFPHDPTGAIRRRIDCIIHANRRLYYDDNTAFDFREAIEENTPHSDPARFDDPNIICTDIRSPPASPHLNTGCTEEAAESNWTQLSQLPEVVGSLSQPDLEILSLPDLEQIDFSLFDDM